MEDKTTTGQLRLIQQLEDEDRQAVFKRNDKMFTNENSKASSRKMSRLWKSKKQGRTTGFFF
ncbi:hypothetical protein [Cyclobacterium roseum]|uniref:hypothetical protein n=1 Tax=Cyclobacterium roseum TaxID=2666137 RepID=UPI001390D89D|nr:hypothetical protein [Cyclobacterium roseum]